MTETVLDRLRGQLIVSCQASPGDAFYGPDFMARFAMAAVAAGAAGIRANGPDDIGAIRRAVSVPIIGIAKQIWSDGRILITPTFESAKAVVDAGADIVALDCTRRGVATGSEDRLRRIRAELGVPVMADIATVEEGVAAAAAGADVVGSTMRGYTDETRQCTAFDAGFIRQMAGAVRVPVVAEGKIANPQDARAAIRAGAFAIVVGTAITMPQAIARSFAAAVRGAAEEHAASRTYVGIDLGATNTKFGAVSGDGKLLVSGAVATPAGTGREGLLRHLKEVARASLEQAGALKPSAIGIATAGWVDAATGRVVYATENLPGWTGTPVGAEIARATGLPAAVENDANALAVAEKHFGCAEDVSDFVVITLGTGVGGGCYIGGKLNRGVNHFANALGHMTIEKGGLPCTCGQRGCLEAYTNAAALMRYAPGFASAEEIIAAANAGSERARQAQHTFAEYLASGVASMVHLLDPELIVLSGGLVQKNETMVEHFREELAARVIAFRERKLAVCISELGYHGGVFGAAAIAAEQFTSRVNES